MNLEEEVPESKERKIPSFLYIVYIVLLIGGLFAFFFFWNGSRGWLDRGFWHELQKGASTTAPYSPQHKKIF